MVFSRESKRVDIQPHRLHVVSTIDGSVDTLDVMPKDDAYSAKSSMYQQRRILDVVSTP